MKSIIPFQLAYAVSIHKAQGLEYNSVKVVIPQSNTEKITHGISIQPSHELSKSMAYTNYQLINTLGLSYAGIEEKVLADSFDYLDNMLADSAFLRYHIHTPEAVAKMQEDEIPDLETYRMETVLDMTCRTPYFENTDFYKSFRRETVSHFKDHYEKADDAGEAEYLWKVAADKGSSAAMYLIYKGYRDGKFTDKPSDKMKYLRMAADKNHAYAEYELAMQTDKRMPNVKLSYLMRAAEHGCTAAEYEIGKLYYENGQTEQGLAYLEEAAVSDLWARMQVGLFYCYTRDDWEHGMELLTSAAEENYAPAEEAIRNIQSGLNAQIFTGLCDLFNMPRISSTSARKKFMRRPVNPSSVADSVARNRQSGMVW